MSTVILEYHSRYFSTSIATRIHEQQASVAAVIDVVVAISGGIAIGRWLWILAALRSSPSLSPRPVVEVLIVALGALVLANIATAVSGQIAPRTPIALVLRAE
jgi:hypothetical protein